MQREYEGVEVQFAPYLLDASVPPEGRPQPPPSGKRSEARSYMEQRAESAGIRFTPGRTHRSSSILSLEAAEFVADHHEECAGAFHRHVFKAYFEDLEDIGQVDTLVRLGEETGLPGEGLRQALEAGVYRRQVEEAVEGARLAGVRSVPTFIFDEEYAIVGAQEYETFQAVMKELGREPRADGGRA